MIYLCVRRTLDWTREAELGALLHAHLQRKVETWNETFTVPYHVFRQRLKEIARENHERVRAVEIAPLDEVPEGALVIPTDDDDWFAPEVAERLREAYDPALQGYYWIRNIAEARPQRFATLRRLLRFRSRFVLSPNARQGLFTCGTNNYALTRTEAIAPLVLSHVAASEHFDAHPDVIGFLPHTLSLQNRNLASQSELARKRDSISREELLTLRQRYRKLYRRLILAPSLHWARPYLEQMAALTFEVEVRPPG